MGYLKLKEQRMLEIFATFLQVCIVLGINGLLRV